jgi:peptide/nickel transport system permease protein
MGTYVIRRLAWMILVVLGMTLITFAITHMIPADPAKIAAGLGADASAVEKIRQELGLDLPLPEQYLFYLKNLLRGDLGRSILTSRPVVDDIKDYFPATLELTVLSMVVTMVLGVFLGILSALQQGRLVDNVTRLFATLWVAMPVFWFALMLQILFYGKLEWLPPGGRISEAVSPPPHITGMFTLDSLLALRFRTLGNALVHLILPVTAVALTRVAGSGCGLCPHGSCQGFVREGGDPAPRSEKCVVAHHYHIWAPVRLPAGRHDSRRIDLSMAWHGALRRLVHH